MIPRASHTAAVLRLTLPPLAAMLLCVAAIYFLILPATHEALLEKKRDTLRAIVASAISLSERHHAAELAGTLTPEQARQRATEDIRALRYGEENKDYLWVINHEPRMIAHPYRADLEGQALGEHTDPDGVKLFVESVRLVEDTGEGFLHYRWQRQDDAAHIDPKLSFVRSFKPWGWIIGSGVYLNDVEADIARSTRNLFIISASTALLLSVLIALGVRQGLLIEGLRLSAEAQLQRSNARYRALAQAAEEAVWLISEERVAGANRSACQLFGCTEEELLGREAASLFADSHEPSAGLPHEAMLNGASSMIPALVTVSSASVQGRVARVITARDLRSGTLPDNNERRRREAAESLLHEALLPSLGWLQAAAPLALPTEPIPLSSTRNEAEAAIVRQGGGALLLTAPDGGIAGLLTPGDLLCRAGNTAYAAMSAPVQRLHADASLAAAADALATCPGHHLLLDTGEHPPSSPSLLHAKAVLDALRHSPSLISVQIEQAPQEDLSDLRQRTLVWLRTLIQLQVTPEVIAAESTRLADATLRRVIALTLEDMGEAPAPFEIIVVGSQGRREILPGSDQDNALIYADGADPHWFHAFSRQLVARYAAAGWPRCEGDMVCANERWCQPLSQWRQQFSTWIDSGSPGALLEIATFFDFRSIQTDAPMAETLRAHVLQEAARHEVFLHMMSQDTLDFRAPLGALGGLRNNDEQAGVVDLKGSLIHFNAFARTQALRHGLHSTGTGARLRELAKNGHLSAAFTQEVLASWQHLLGLRLKRRAQPSADDRIKLDTLSAWEQATLKHALGTITELQNRLRHEQERKA